MSTPTITPAELEALIARAMEACNTSAANARSVARALTQAEIDGQKGHGLSRVPSYGGQSKSGKVDGQAVPEAKQTRPGSLMVDAKHGFAFPAFDLAIARLPEMARATGIAAAGFTRSHHSASSAITSRSSPRRGWSRWLSATRRRRWRRGGASSRCTAPTRSGSRRRIAGIRPSWSTWR